MAREAGEAGQQRGEHQDSKKPFANGKPGDDNDNGDHDSSEEEEEEEEEPRLKYEPLTKHLKPVYRNGDATSAFLVAGDKMVSLLTVWKTAR